MSEICGDIVKDKAESSQRFIGLRIGRWGGLNGGEDWAETGGLIVCLGDGFVCFGRGRMGDGSNRANGSDKNYRDAGRLRALTDTKEARGNRIFSVRSVCLKKSDVPSCLFCLRVCGLTAALRLIGRRWRSVFSGVRQSGGRSGAGLR